MDDCLLDMAVRHTFVVSVKLVHETSKGCAGYVGSKGKYEN
jgi:hypothetical protein